MNIKFFRDAKGKEYKYRKYIIKVLLFVIYKCK